MTETIGDLVQFLGNPEIPATKLMNLLGKQRPSPAFGGTNLKPHDNRFRMIVVYVDPRDPGLIHGIAFVCPDNPINLGEVEQFLGSYEIKYREKDNMSLFIATDFPEGSVLETFIGRMENYKFENTDNPQMFKVHMPDGSVHDIPIGDIFIDFFRFNFIEREAVPDPEAAKRNTSDPMAVLRSRMKKKK
ncbi:MAG: hypothetical protein AAF570_09500 [Bacteroidota bacterium]